MEAFFIALMAAVVLLTGWVSAVVLYKLFKADNTPGMTAGNTPGSTSDRTAR